MVCPISVITKTLIFIQGVTFRSILFHDHTRVYITKPLGYHLYIGVSESASAQNYCKL